MGWEMETDLCALRAAVITCMSESVVLAQGFTRQGFNSTRFLQESSEQLGSAMKGCFAFLSSALNHSAVSVPWQYPEILTGKCWIPVGMQRTNWQWSSPSMKCRLREKFWTHCACWQRWDSSAWEEKHIFIDAKTQQKWFISVLELKNCFKESCISGGKWVWKLQHVICYKAQFKIHCKPLIVISDRDPQHSEAEEAACKAGAGLGFCKGKVGEHFSSWGFSVRVSSLLASQGTALICCWILKCCCEQVRKDKLTLEFHQERTHGCQIQTEPRFWSSYMPGYNQKNLGNSSSFQLIQVFNLNKESQKFSA